MAFAASSLMQLPMVARSLGKGRVPGVLTYDAGSLGPENFEANGADPTTPFVGMPQGGAFHGLIEGGQPHDPVAMEREIVEAARDLLARRPDVGAIVLECTNMPPFAHSVAKACSLPVFDILTLGHWLFAATAPRRFDDERRTDGMATNGISACFGSTGHLPSGIGLYGRLHAADDRLRHAGGHAFRPHPPVRLKILTVPVMAIVELFRCTPVLVQLVWCYYALPMLIGIQISPAMAAFVTLTLYGAAFYAEIVRGGIISIEVGQWDAGQAIGMRRGQLMTKIILPQALRRMVPPLVKPGRLQLKNTSLLSVLAVPDLLYHRAARDRGDLPPPRDLHADRAPYLAVLFPLTRAAQWMESGKKA